MFAICNPCFSGHGRRVRVWISFLYKVLRDCGPKCLSSIISCHCFSRPCYNTSCFLKAHVSSCPHNSVHVVPHPGRPLCFKALFLYGLNPSSDLRGRSLCEVFHNLCHFTQAPNSIESFFSLPSCVLCVSLIKQDHPLLQFFVSSLDWEFPERPWLGSVSLAP